MCFNVIRRVYSWFLKRNTFYRFKIRPRFLRDVSQRDLSTTVLGTRVAFPIGISPTAMQRMAHPDGECATARGNIPDCDNEKKCKHDPFHLSVTKWIVIASSDNVFRVILISLQL